MNSRIKRMTSNLIAAVLARGMQSARGSVLVIVVGVLALMALLVTIYATLGQADRRTSAALRNDRQLRDQAEEISGYFADMLGKGTLKAWRKGNPLDFTRSDPNRDIYFRHAVDFPSIDPNLLSQTTDPAVRYRPAYFASDQRPANEVLPPDSLPPGSILTHWRDDTDPSRPDPRIPTSPALADMDPTWLRLRDNGLIPSHRDPARPQLENRDWAMISNPAPDGRFVNLATIRNNYFAQSGIGRDLLGRPRTTYGLTLLDKNGAPTLDLALPPFWNFQRTQVDWTAGPGQPSTYFPSDFTARQQSMLRLPRETRPGNTRTTLPRGYGGVLAGGNGLIIPGDWEYFDNQYVDADGDGLADARWFELRDASDPGTDGNFGTNDDVVANLIRENGNLRLFVAARIVDLSAKINVQTATQQRTQPDRLNQVGLDPSHVDLERVLGMRDTYASWPRAGYEAYAQPLRPYVQGAPSYPSNYRDNVSYGSTWIDQNRTHYVADTVGSTGFAALIDERVTGSSPSAGLAWSRGRNDLFAPATVRAGNWPFDATPGVDVWQAEWKPEYRTQLYRMFARDPGARLVRSEDTNRFYEPWVSPTADPIRDQRIARVTGNSVQSGGLVGPIQSEIELRSFETVNDPTVTSQLEMTLGARFGKLGNQSYAHLHPLRSNRPYDLETLGRDLSRPTANGFQNQPDNDVDPDALLQLRTDVRRQLTNIGGQRSLVSTDVTRNLLSLSDQEVAINLPLTLSSIWDDLAEPSRQTVRQQLIHSIFRATADTLMPFASLRDDRPIVRDAAWFPLENGVFRDGLPRKEQKLFFGADRAFLGIATDPAAMPYRGNSAELALRLSAHLTANLIAGRRAPKTLLDPANPIHPDDLELNFEQIDLLWNRVLSADSNSYACNTDYWLYPGSSDNPAPDANYFKYPRFPRLDWNAVPNNTNDLESSLAYTDAVQFRNNREGVLVPFRTRSEAWDVPVVFSVLFEDGFRNRMSMQSVFTRPGFTPAVDERYPTFGSWNRQGDVAPVGTLAPIVAGRLDLSERGTQPKLCPATQAVNPSGDPIPPPPLPADDALLSARAMNLFGITPQPFIVQAVGMVLYCDTPEGNGRLDPGDVDGPPQPPAVGPAHITINAQVLDAGGVRDETGNLLPRPQQKGFADHVVEAFAFQLHNPFNVPLSLSAIKDMVAPDGTILKGRTLPDMSRRRVIQDRDNGRAGSEGTKLPLPQPDSLLSADAWDTRYYIEFGQRYYAMVGVDPTGVENYAITLEPGETRWFYVTDNDLDTVAKRMRNSDEAGFSSLPGSTNGGELVETWFTNLFTTHEPLGMSTLTSNLAARNLVASAQPVNSNPVNINLKNLKRQPVFQNPPTRLLRVNPRTMLPLRNQLNHRSLVPQPMPPPGQVEERRKFLDSRRAVRLWRVNRDVWTQQHADARDEQFGINAAEKEGEYIPATRKTQYHQNGTPYINQLGNDQLIDVLRDPAPWRKTTTDPLARYEAEQNENQWTAPTLHRRLRDTGSVEIELPPNDAQALALMQGVAFINWGSIRRPSDPKLDLKLYRNDPTRPEMMSEMPEGVLPAYCIEVKSTLPYRAGMLNDTNGINPLATRTSLNWELINGRRRLGPNYEPEWIAGGATPLNDPNSPFAADPRQFDFFSVNVLSDIDYPRMATRIDSNGGGGGGGGGGPVFETALGKLLGRGLGVPVVNPSTRPVRLFRDAARDGNTAGWSTEVLNLAPQLQDRRTDPAYDSTPPNGAVLRSIEPVFSDPTTPYQRALRDRLQFMRNASGVEFSKLYMRMPMLCPPVHRATDRQVNVPQMRPADILMVPAVGAYEIPVTLAGAPWETLDPRIPGNPPAPLDPHEQWVLDIRWTTLSEAAAAALDYDFDDSLRQPAGQVWLPPGYENYPTGPGGMMPADYRLGAQVRDLELPDPYNRHPEYANTEIGGCLDRGTLRTDRFVAYVDEFNYQGALVPDGRFTSPRLISNNGKLVGDTRLGNGVPMALNLLDKFVTLPFGSKDSMVAGRVNINPASLQVKRALPMVTPDKNGWMGPSGRNGFGEPFDPLGQVYAKDLYRPLDLSGYSRDQLQQVQGIYAPWLETFDIAATLEAYSRKNIVRTRTIWSDLDPDARVGIDVGYRDDAYPMAAPNDRRAPGLNEPFVGRQGMTNIPGLREDLGFNSVGEVLCAKQDPRFFIDPLSPLGVQPLGDDFLRYSIINNYDNTGAGDPALSRDATFLQDDNGVTVGSNARTNMHMNFFADVSIDRFGRDDPVAINVGLGPKPKLAPSKDWISNQRETFDRANLGYWNGRPLEGLLSSGRDPIHQRAEGMPTAAETVEDKYVIANGLLNSISVRSDVFCVWFVVRGYSPTDVEGLTPEDPMVPSLQRRYVMVVDRSNVTKIGDKPRVLFVQEVPMP